MRSLRGLLKPCYLFSPGTAIRRVWLEFFPHRTNPAIVLLPWKVTIEVDLSEAVGNEIFKQRVFDIGVSEVAWRLLRAGDKVADVGANIGYLTSLFAFRVGREGVVHAFEPHPEVGERLKRNIVRMDLNCRSSPITMHASALGNVAGHAELIETDYFQINRGAARIAEPNSDPATCSHPVAMETLDDVFAEQSLDLLKIDVEGFEPRVLQGASRLLREKRVRHIIYEDHASERTGLAQMLQSQGYSIFSIGYDLLGPKLRELDEQIAIDRNWESPNFLATIEPATAKDVMRPRGWQIFAAHSRFRIAR